MEDEIRTGPPYWDFEGPDDDEPLVEDGTCEFCGADLMDGCDCHVDIFGFPMNCSED